MNKQEVTVSELLPKIYHHINVAVRSALKEAMERSSENNPSKEKSLDEVYFCSVQASSYLKIKLNTLYAKAEKGEIPYSRSGKRKLLFSKKDLEQYVAKRRVKSNDEINDDANDYINNKK